MMRHSIDVAKAPMRIDFVSDIACPWCAVGLNSLERALARIGDDIPIELHFQPFELNPSMPAEGADAVEYLSAKYGIDAAQIARTARRMVCRFLGYTAWLKDFFATFERIRNLRACPETPRPHGIRPVCAA